LDSSNDGLRALIVSEYLRKKISYDDMAARLALLSRCADACSRQVEPYASGFRFREFWELVERRAPTGAKARLPCIA
jgi:hypothetical protein